MRSACDVQFVEAARKFAERIMLGGGADAKSKVDYAFRSVVSRFPTVQESATLQQLYREYQAEFKKSPSEAEEFLQVGDMPRNASLTADELAAWTMIAHLILNLSESVTKG